MTTPQLLTLAQLLELLHTPGEHTSINHLPPGGQFTTRTLPSADAQTHANTLTGDVWYGLNPIHPHTTARGTTNDITRLAALPADLDIKPGALPDFDTARAVIHDLATMLETRPTATVNSGHGLQPIWALDPNDPTLHLDTPQKRTAAQALLRRWGRLVTTVARAHGGTVDNIFDLPRILRAPGTTNHKHHPLPVLAIADTGHPLTAAQVDDALTAYGVPELPEDTEQLGTTISPPDDWAWADHTCIYAQRMLTGWTTDTPTARHPWLVSQATRLAALHRLGCITQHDHTNAQHALAERFRHLLTTGETRPEHRDEITEALTWGTLRVAAMTDERARREVGNHPHQFEDLIPPEHQPTPTPPQRHLQAVDGTAALAPRLDNDDNQDPPPPPATTTVVEFERRPAPNEDNTALLLIDRHQHEIRYVSRRGTWLTWNGHRWETDEDNNVHEHARHIARQLPEGEGWATYKKRALSYNGIRGITNLAKSDRRILAPVNNLDAHPYELNTPHGPVDLRTGKLHPPNPDDLHTRATVIPPDFNQPTPMWDKFLADTFAGDPEMIDFIARAIGMSLIGQVLEQVFFFAFGSGANGKSTLMAVLQHIIGTGQGGYSGTSPAELLLATKNRGHPTELARLAGQRLVVTAELDDGQRFDEARIKDLTGKDDITARFMRQDFFDFTPTHTLWLLANHQPQVRVGGMAFWRRVRMIPFVHTVPENERIPDLEEQLIENEGPGILAWAIRGATDYINRGRLDEPAAVLAATQDYESGQNSVGQFVEDMCEVGNPNAQHMHVRSSVLRAAYERWCTEEGVEPVTVKSFTMALKSQFGVQTSRTNQARYLDGIRLQDLGDDASPDASPADEATPWWQA